MDPVHATGKLLLAGDESQLLLQWKANSQAYELDAKYSRSTPGEHLIYAKIQADDKLHLLSIKAKNGQDKMLEIDFQADKHYFFLGKVSSSVLVDKATYIDRSLNPMLFLLPTPYSKTYTALKKD